MTYIPDITERFPEGFGGVDMTPSFFGEPVDWSQALRSEYDEDDEEEEQKRGQIKVPYHKKSSLNKMKRKDETISQIVDDFSLNKVKRKDGGLYGKYY